MRTRETKIVKHQINEAKNLEVLVAKKMRLGRIRWIWMKSTEAVQNYSDELGEYMLVVWSKSKEEYRLLMGEYSELILVESELLRILEEN